MTSRPQITPPASPTVSAGRAATVRHRVLRIAHGAALAAVVTAAPADAQSGAPGAGAREAARRAQARFERVRVQHLPDAPGGLGERCDARIGRFCYWYDSTEPEPPPEPARIAHERAALSRALDSAAARAPGDGWITGQRVRYLVEAGHADEALAAAATCADTEPGWCAALRGLAAHADGRAATADSAFDEALALMVPAERCRWTDLEPLLDGRLRERYARLSCAARDSLHRRLWWLAQPLYGRPGNPLRAEHLARVVMARLHQHARPALSPRWGDDLREMLVRYGWATAYTRDRVRERGVAGGSAGGGALVVGHEPRPSYHFFPTHDAVETPAAALPGSWTLDPPIAPTRYAPGLSIEPLAGQSAWFRRGDSTLVVTAYSLRGDSAFIAGADGVLALYADEHTAPVLARVAHHAAAADERAVLTATAPWRPAIVGVEVVARDGRAARRARHGFGVPPPPAPLALSSMLLFDPADTLPTSLAGALPAMRPHARAKRDERIGILWELYGLADSARHVTVSLGAERLGGTRLVRRAAEALRLRRPIAPVVLRWGTRAENTAGVATGSIVLRAADLAPGRYRVTVEVRDENGAAAAAHSELVVERE